MYIICIHNHIALGLHQLGGVAWDCINSVNRPEACARRTVFGSGHFLLACLKCVRVLLSHAYGTCEHARAAAQSACTTHIHTSSTMSFPDGYRECDRCKKQYHPGIACTQCTICNGLGHMSTQCERRHDPSLYVMIPIAPPHITTTARCCPTCEQPGHPEEKCSIPCTICFKKGHWRMNCPKSLKSIQIERDYCTICRSLKHTNTSCTYKCSICLLIGRHRKCNCPRRPRNNNNSTK